MQNLVTQPGGDRCLCFVEGDLSLTENKGEVYYIEFKKTNKEVNTQYGVANSQIDAKKVGKVALLLLW